VAPISSATFVHGACPGSVGALKSTRAFAPPDPSGTRHLPLATFLLSAFVTILDAASSISPAFPTLTKNTRGGGTRLSRRASKRHVAGWSDSQPRSNSGKISRMEFKVLFSEDPGFVLRTAEEFLSSEPVLHNMILSILHARVAMGDPGRYWIAFQGERAVGVVLQSPLDFPATLTPMESRAVLAIVDAIAQAGVTLPGVNGDAATAASFAGQWGERRKSAATPLMGMRLYELLELGEVPRTEGRLRQAGPSDRILMIQWSRAFQIEIGESANDTELRVDRGLAAGQLWVWDQNGETTSMAVGREPVQGVVRLSGVYTPPEKQKHGYAAACVHALSKHLRAGGYRCVLYTDLANPTSNSIYRRIGYRAVAEALRYRFD
jgi:ribosomal protein S18 acetylase RimI-like enzyme